MRLIIDHELARSSNVGSRFSIPAEREGMVLLDVPAEVQQMEKWCWAAIASSLGRYYRTRTLSQAEVASQVLNNGCQGASAAGLEMDTESRLDKAMRVAGCYSHWTPGKPLFDRVRFEINLGRPFAARIGWHNGEGHYVLVNGYRNAGRHLWVTDPLSGTGEHPYADFPSAYRQGGTWTETFWTTPGAPAGEAPLNHAPKSTKIN